MPTKRNNAASRPDDENPEWTFLGLAWVRLRVNWPEARRGLGAAMTRGGAKHHFWPDLLAARSHLRVGLLQSLPADPNARHVERVGQMHEVGGEARREAADAAVEAEEPRRRQRRHRQRRRERQP